MSYLLVFLNALFQFLHPVLLWALAGVAVPVAIHLWNKRPPKVVEVGSIKWLQPSKSQRLSRLQLTNLWLLLLRSLLVALLALILAEPQWKRQVSVLPERNVYLHPALLLPAYAAQIVSHVDSLVTRGWQVHLLQPGFPELSFTAEESLSKYQTDSVKADSVNAWAMLRVLSRSLPPHAHATVFSTDLLRHHQGEYPVMHDNFNWVPVSSPQTAVWLQEAFYTTSGQLLVKFGRSEANRVEFIEHRFTKTKANEALSASGFPTVRFISHSSADSLALVESTKNKIEIQKLPLQVIIRHDKARQQDVKYIRAALQTALEHKGISHTLTVSSSSAPLPNAAPDWIFWLTDEPLAPFLARFPEKRLKTLQDARTSTKAHQLNSWLQIPGIVQQVPLHKRTSSGEKEATAKVLWQDGYGNPMLTQTLTQNHTQYQFFSRFHPSWNDLPDSGHFPELLYQLLFPANEAWLTKFDTRTLPPQLQQPQLFPASFSKNSPKTVEEVIDLKLWLVALAALLLALERWLAGQSFKQARQP